MYSLILDSSTKLLFVGILKNNNLISKKTRMAKKDHAFYISSFVNQVLKENKIKPNEIKEVIVGEGPGSYTGLRVSGTFAKVFAYSLNIKFFKISSLFLLTSGYHDKHIAVYNAKNNRYYALGFSKEKTFLKEDVYPLEKLEEYRFDKITLTNDNLDEIVKLDYKLIKENVKEDNYFSYEPNYSYGSKYDKTN